MFDRLYQFVAETSSAQIPTDAWAVATRQTIDTIACALAASALNDVGSAIVGQYWTQLGGAPQCSLLGHSGKLPASAAALVNGYLAHALDYDDYTLSSWIGHPSVVLLPALLAVAERDGYGGQALLRAYVIGYEVGARLGLTAGSLHYKHGWHNTSTLGVVAATAALANLRGFNLALARQSLAIAASMASGLKRNFGTMTKPLHVGMAAERAVIASDLAVAGLTAADDAIAGSQGLLAALAGQTSDDIDPALIEQINNLGQTWDLLTPGVSIKLYPSCAYSHWAIDAALMANAAGLQVSQIQALVLCCDSVVPEVCIHHQPTTALQGKFSLEYCVALALVKGRVGLGDFLPQAIKDPQINQTMNLVRYQVEQRFAAQPWGGQLVVQLSNGTEQRFIVDHPSGSAAKPLTMQQLRVKFNDCLATWPAAKQQMLWEALLTLPQSDATGLKKILALVTDC